MRILQSLVVGLFIVSSPVFAVTFSNSRALTLNGTENADALRGIWHSPQQGYVIDLTARKPRVFHLTDGACWPDSDLAEVAKDAFALGRFSDDKSQLKASAAIGASETLLVRMKALPARCSEKADSSPKAVFEAVWQTMNEHYAFFAQRRVDWADAGEKARMQINAETKDEALYESISKLLSTTNDAHVTFQAKINGRERRLTNGRGATLTALRSAYESSKQGGNPADFYNEWIRVTRSNVDSVLLGGRGKSALNGVAFWGVNRDAAGGDIGYLALSNLSGYTRGGSVIDDIEAVDRWLDEIIDACKSCNAMIVDISQNRGGDDRVAMAVAARFATQSVAVYNKQAYSRTASADVQPFVLTPSSKPRFTGSVALVTDSVTVSAAEVLTLAMRALPNVNHVGQPTRGALSDALEKSLPNGWRFTLSNEIYRDASGELFEARGIPPKRLMPIFDAKDLFASHAPAIMSIAKMLRKP